MFSVYDKSGLVDFAREIEKRGIEVVATSGTFKTLRGAGLSSLRKVSEVTGFPEILDGKVKTVHPQIMAGILALRDNEEHMRQLKKLGIRPFDMVVCNLYPFPERVQRKTDLESALNSIDIGGPNLIRAAAKNFKHVAVVVNPQKYDDIIKELSQKGNISLNTRLSLAKEAFSLTTEYDSAIQRFLKKEIKKSLPCQQ